MKSALLAALPIVMLTSAIVGGFMYSRRSLSARIADLADGCRIIEDLLERTKSANVGEATPHLIMAKQHQLSASVAHRAGDRDEALEELRSGYAELRAARELVQRPDDEDQD